MSGDQRHHSEAAAGDGDADSRADTNAEPVADEVRQPEEEAADRLTVAAGQREYEAATARWFSATVEKVMRATDPVYAQIPHQRVESLPELVVPLPDGQEMHVAPEHLAAGGDVSPEGIITGQIDDVHLIATDAAEQRLRQVMQMFFTQVQEATGRVGNLVDAEGDPVEGFLSALDRMQLTFGDDAPPRLQMIASADDTDRIRQALDSATPDQIRRLQEILRRKREEFDAARRRRRLPRHGD
jgi:hypothetical protein